MIFRKLKAEVLELQEHVRQLRIQKKQMEDAEIIKAIRSMKMDSRKMLTFSEIEFGSKHHAV